MPVWLAAYKFQRQSYRFLPPPPFGFKKTGRYRTGAGRTPRWYAWKIALAVLHRLIPRSAPVGYVFALQEGHLSLPSPAPAIVVRRFLFTRSGRLSPEVSAAWGT